MYKIFCRTNLDLISEKWPNELPAIPRVGEGITSTTQHIMDNGISFHLTLKVVSVTWNRSYLEKDYIPIIELHDPLKRSITEFYEWYAPFVRKSVSSFNKKYLKYIKKDINNILSI